MSATIDDLVGALRQHRYSSVTPTAAASSLSSRSDPEGTDGVCRKPMTKPHARIGCAAFGLRTTLLRKLFA